MGLVKQKQDVCGFGQPSSVTYTCLLALLLPTQKSRPAHHEDMVLGGSRARHCIDDVRKVGESNLNLPKLPRRCLRCSLASQLARSTRVSPHGSTHSAEGAIHPPRPARAGSIQQLRPCSTRARARLDEHLTRHRRSTLTHRIWALRRVTSPSVFPPSISARVHSSAQHGRVDAGRR